MEKQDFYTIKEIATAQRKSTRQILNICKSGKLPYYQDCPGGKIVVYHDDYINWLLSTKKVSV